MAAAQKYRKKPVVIEAVEFKAGETLDSAFVGDAEGVFKLTEDGTLLVATTEGTMEARPGDMIIKGVAGEFYPCKRPIFDRTYNGIHDDDRAFLLTHNDAEPTVVAARTMDEAVQRWKELWRERWELEADDDPEEPDQCTLVADIFG